jgi:hypothetical protein
MTTDTNARASTRPAADYNGFTPSAVIARAVLHERANEARNYRDGIANAIADFVSDGITPSQALIERYRAAALDSQLAADRSMSALEAAVTGWARSA